jgi:CHAT domain-containing protein
LVTVKPGESLPTDAESYRRAAWLGMRQPITVLPAVSSLHALRGLARNGVRAPEPYIGFGDPDLMGQPRKCAKARRLPAECPTVATHARLATVASAQGNGEGTRSSEPVPPSEQFFKGGLADPVVVRSQCPLPESAFELKCVAESLDAPHELIYTRGQATETALKGLPLDRYRVVHFATHGLLAGDTEKMGNGLSEPALVLTPPRGPATVKDDGLLTATEITQLKLNAEWIILSACNTAGSGDKPGVAPLSGLARAFFYAGARALLVSHWRVDSFAAVWLITDAFDELRGNREIGRSEALRRSMLALAASATPRYAHPIYWAPFTVVGEGAR